MPQMSGYEVAAELCPCPKFADVYIAALTGWNDPKTRAQVAAGCFDKHMTKPAKIEDVLDLVAMQANSFAARSEKKPLTEQAAAKPLPIRRDNNYLSNLLLLLLFRVGSYPRLVLVVCT